MMDIVVVFIMIDNWTVRVASSFNVMVNNTVCIMENMVRLVMDNFSNVMNWIFLVNSIMMDYFSSNWSRNHVVIDMMVMNVVMMIINSN